MERSIKLLSILAIVALTACDAKKSDDNNNQSEGVSAEVISESNPHSASGDANLQKTADIKWDEKRHNFGKVHYQQKVLYNFQFTNTGETDLLIVDAQASCGCTTPEFSKEPIKPGERGSITVGFKSSAEGPFSKQITVTANTSPDKHALYISGEVIKAE
ncbi:DUF1573 domain-containing protein [bacterium]|nr:DUF1573 domain-containing protein [bacterium]